MVTLTTSNGGTIHSFQRVQVSGLHILVLIYLVSYATLTCRSWRQLRGAQLKSDRFSIIRQRQLRTIARIPFILNQKLLARLHVFGQERPFDVTSNRVANIDVDPMIRFVQEFVWHWFKGHLKWNFSDTCR